MTNGGNTFTYKVRIPIGRTGKNYRRVVTSLSRAENLVPKSESITVDEFSVADFRRRRHRTAPSGYSPTTAIFAHILYVLDYDDGGGGGGAGE